MDGAVPRPIGLRRFVSPAAFIHDFARLLHVLALTSVFHIASHAGTMILERFKPLDLNQVYR